MWRSSSSHHLLTWIYNAPPLHHTNTLFNAFSFGNSTTKSLLTIYPVAQFLHLNESDMAIKVINASSTFVSHEPAWSPPMCTRVSYCLIMLSAYNTKMDMLSFNYTLLFVRIHYLSILFYLDNELAATMERLLTLIVLWSLVPFASQKKIMTIGQLAI